MACVRACVRELGFKAAGQSGNCSRNGIGRSGRAGRRRGDQPPAECIRGCARVGDGVSLSLPPSLSRSQSLSPFPLLPHLRLLQLTSTNAVHRCACRHNAAPAAFDTSPLRKECSGGSFTRIHSQMRLQVRERWRFARCERARARSLSPRPPETHPHTHPLTHPPPSTFSLCL